MEVLISGRLEGTIPNASIASGMVLKPPAGLVMPFGCWGDILADDVVLCSGTLSIDLLDRCGNKPMASYGMAQWFFESRRFQSRCD